MEEFLDRLLQLTIRGHAAEASALANAEDSGDPLKMLLGHAMIAAAQNDAARLEAYALSAEARAPDNPFVAQALAMSYLIKRQFTDAEYQAKRAFSLDGSARSQRGLANVYLAMGRTSDAERILRELVSREEDLDARILLGRTRAGRGDHAAALQDWSKAFVAAPHDPRSVNQVIGAYREAGWPLGVIMLTRVTRGGIHPPEVQTMLDLVALQMHRQLTGTPLADLLNVEAEIVSGLLESSAALAPAAQLKVARILVDDGRRTEALEIIARLPTRDLDQQAQAQIEFLRGLIQAGGGDKAQALVSYQRAITNDPTLWEAACNAVHLCLEKKDLELASKLIDAVPEPIRRDHAPMTFNEAVWLDQSGRRDEARKLLSWLKVEPSTGLDAQLRALEARLAPAAPTTVLN